MRVTLKFENIGGNTFHLTVQSITFDLPRSKHNFLNLPETRPLSSAGSFTHSFEMTPQEEGLGWLTVGVASEGQEIECYQSPDSAFSLNQWLRPIYVLKPEDYRIIELLERIARIEK